MTDHPHNPVDIEQGIRDCADRIHASVQTTSSHERLARRLRREYDAAFARAYINASGPAHEKRYHAELATQTKRQEAEDAEVAYRYADRQAKAQEQELRALQSVGASVRSMYQVETGVGR